MNFICVVFSKLDTWGFHGLQFQLWIRRDVIHVLNVGRFWIQGSYRIQNPRSSVKGHQWSLRYSLEGRRGHFYFLCREKSLQEVLCTFYVFALTFSANLTATVWAALLGALAVIVICALIAYANPKAWFRTFPSFNCQPERTQWREKKYAYGLNWIHAIKVGDEIDVNIYHGRYISLFFAQSCTRCWSFPKLWGTDGL